MLQAAQASLSCCKQSSSVLPTLHSLAGAELMQLHCSFPTPLDIDAGYLLGALVCGLVFIGTQVILAIVHWRQAIGLDH
jgi:hypothetical protein